MTTIRSAPGAGAPAARQAWTGQWGFIISAIGSAVGLGNIWRFPGVAYTNGGGAFLIPYLVALLTAGIPILFLDYALGHRLRGSAPLAFRRVARWAESIGWFQVMICFFIAIYYAAVLAWAASFFVFSFNQKWESGESTAAFFVGDYLKAAEAPSFSLQPVWGVFIPLALVWIATLFVLGRKLTRGIERANVVFMPLLVVAFLVLVVRSLFLPGATEGLNALFTPDFSKLGDANVWIAAYSQIFFSLSIAFGIMITYASYRRRKSNQTGPGLVVAFANSSFEILAGIGVFAILGFMATEAGQTFTEFGEDPSNRLAGVGLSFMTFPRAISQMPQAWFFGALFFGSLLMAGFTSMVSIVEVISSGFQDKFGWTRAKAAMMLGVPSAVVSLLLFGTTTGFYALDVVDHFTNNLGIVFSAIAMMIVTLWLMRKGPEFAYHLASLSTFKVGRVWRVLVTLVGPVVLAYMLVKWFITTLGEGYDPATYGDHTWYTIVFGWGAALLMVIGAWVFSALRWRMDPDDFTPWPHYAPPGPAEPAEPAGRARTAVGTEEV